LDKGKILHILHICPKAIGDINELSKRPAMNQYLLKRKTHPNAKSGQTTPNIE
jgi:hypothetical protein